jgi:hypothetical protein
MLLVGTMAAFFRDESTRAWLGVVVLGLSAVFFGGTALLVKAVRSPSRMLPPDVASAVGALPANRYGQRIVGLVLDDGRVIPRVYVVDGRVTWVGARPWPTFDISRVRAVKSD